MATFMRVTDRLTVGVEHLINTDTVIKVSTSNPMINGKGHSEISLSNGQVVSVKESVDEVMAWLRRLDEK